MNLISILLGLVILAAILSQTVLKEKATDGSTDQIKTQQTKALQAIKDAEKLKEMLNENQQNMDYDAQMKNH